MAELVPRWGLPHTSWPLVYVSAHGYGVVEADDVTLTLTLTLTITPTPAPSPQPPTLTFPLTLLIYP